MITTLTLGHTDQLVRAPRQFAAAMLAVTAIELPHVATAATAPNVSATTTPTIQHSSAMSDVAVSSWLGGLDGTEGCGNQSFGNPSFGSDRVDYSTKRILPGRLGVVT